MLEACWYNWVMLRKTFLRPLSLQKRSHGVQQIKRNHTWALPLIIELERKVKEFSLSEVFHITVSFFFYENFKSLVGISEFLIRGYIFIITLTLVSYLENEQPFFIASLEPSWLKFQISACAFTRQSLVTYKWMATVITLTPPGTKSAESSVQWEED